MALQRRSSVEWRQRCALHALIAAALMLRSSVAHTHQFSPLSLLPSFLPLRQSVSPRFSPDLSIDAVSWPYKSLPKSYPVSAVCRRPVRPWSQLDCRLPCRIQSLLSCQRIAGGMAEMQDSWRTPDRMLISKFTVEHIDWVAYRFKIRKNSGILLFKKIR